MKYFSQTFLSLAIIFHAHAIVAYQASHSGKPQTPKAPYPYQVETIEVVSQLDETVLGGTLTTPSQAGKFPLVILLSVAGPNDRDQSFAGHAGFHVIADYLTKQGIAVARFDDRGVGSTGGVYFDASWEDLSIDTQSIVEQLKQHPKVDQNRIGLVGMSQGGAVAAMTSIREPEVDFVVLLSAPGLSGVDTLTQQFEKLLSVSNLAEPQMAQYQQLFEQYLVLVTLPSGDSTRVAKLSEFLQGPGRSIIPRYQFVPKQTAALVEMLYGPWYQSNLQFKPEAIYSNMRVPTLVIGGTLDWIAPAGSHLKAIEKMLESAPSPGFKVIKVEGANHLLQQAESGSPLEYPLLENSISEAVLSALAEWISKRS